MLQNLVLALGVTFSIIFLGYGLRMTKVLTGDHAAGVSRLVGRVALPSLLFLSMATIDFGNVQWFFVLGLALARFLVFWLVIGLSMLVGSGGRAHLSEAALRGVFATQSNDFALGLPVLTALYPPDITQVRIHAGREEPALATA
jgi:predicted permease